MFRAAHCPSSGAQNCTSSLWFCIRETLLDIEVVGQRPATSTSNNLSHMQNQRLLVQFWAPDDGRRVARNMLSFIQLWNNKFWYTFASCWLFLYELYYDVRTHKHQANIFIFFLAQFKSLQTDIHVFWHVRMWMFIHICVYTYLCFPIAYTFNTDHCTVYHSSIGV